jgi:hypothetical protein
MKDEISHNLVWFPVFLIGCINISMSLLSYLSNQVFSNQLTIIPLILGLTIITIVVITKLGKPKNRIFTLIFIFFSETAFFTFFKTQVSTSFFDALFLLGFLLLFLSSYSSIQFKSN